MSKGPESDPPADDALQALREALRLSPNNIALRQHLAETLLTRGFAEEAEKEFREALGLARVRFCCTRGFWQESVKLLKP
jgi:hypothetical protein